MAETIDLGSVTAYASAVEGGFNGTYEQFQTYMADFANIASSIDSALIDKADLVNGKVPPSQLPSYVDDVIEGYYKVADGKFYKESTYVTEIPGETGKIYVDLNNDSTYRWSGSAFIEISNPIVVDTSMDSSSTNPVQNKVITGALDGKASKVTSATNGNFAGLDSNGNLTDSGKKASDFVTTSGESGDTVVTFTDTSTDATITSGSTLKTIIALIKYKLTQLLPSANVKTSYQSSPSTGQVYDAAYVNGLAGYEAFEVRTSSSSTAGKVQTAWSSGTTSIAGKSCYSKTLTLTNPVYGIPKIMLKPSSGTPTATEEEQFNCLDYYGVDSASPNSLKLYAVTKPTSNFSIYIERTGGRV